MDVANIEDITNLIKQIETEANTTIATTTTNESSLIDSSLIDKAAVKIQSTYRGYKTRNDFKKQKQTAEHTNIEVNTSSEVKTSVSLNLASELSIKEVPEINLVESSIQQQDLEETARSQTLNEDASQKIDDSLINNTNQSANLDDAAVKIQSTYRGYKTRKDLSSKKNSLISNSKLEASSITSNPSDSSSSSAATINLTPSNDNCANDDDDDITNTTNNDKPLSKKQKKNKKKQAKKHNKTQQDEMLDGNSN